jgi:hypothetical protein
MVLFHRSAGALKLSTTEQSRFLIFILREVSGLIGAVVPALVLMFVR